MVASHQKLAILLTAQGRPEEAIVHLRRAAELSPDDAALHNALGELLSRAQSWVPAIEAFTEALRIKPDFAEAHVSLANVSARTGQYQQAVEHYVAALESDPRRINAARRLAWILAAADDPQVRDGAQAVRWAEQAANLTEHKNPYDLDMLAAAYAEAGRWDEAVTTASYAIRLATAAGHVALSGQIEARLLLYQRQKPFTVPPAQ